MGCNPDYRNLLVALYDAEALLDIEKLERARKRLEK